jgi:hypothetical protein
MPVINLTPDQLGEFDPDGNISKRPTQDITGADITALHGTMKRLRLGGKKYFVTIPPGKDNEANEYKLAEEPKAASAPAPKSKE